MDTFDKEAAKEYLLIILSSFKILASIGGNVQYQVPQNIDMEDPPSSLLQKGLHPLLAVRATADRFSRFGLKNETLCTKGPSGVSFVSLPWLKL